MLRAVLLVLLLATGVRAQTSTPLPPGPSAFTDAQRREIIEILRHALRTDPTILRDAVEAIQADDSNRESVAARRAVAENDAAIYRAAGDPVAGNPNGDVTLVEFYDVRCPYCRRMLPAIAELLKRDPKLRIIYKDIPILGPGSVIAARAVLAAQKQGAYLKMREALMTGPGQIDAEVVKAAATRLGLDAERLQRDMADPAIQARLDANLKLAHLLNIKGTPAYVIAGEIIPGAVSADDLASMVAHARKK